MDDSYYKRQFEEIALLTDKSAEKRSSFLQSLLIVSVTLLGILISLHGNTTHIQSLRLMYAIAVVLLSLGILCTSIVLYDWSMILERGRKVLVEEAQSALKENRKLKPLFVQRKKTAVICEKISYITLSCSLLLLTFYSVMSLFSINV